MLQQNDSIFSNNWNLEKKGVGDATGNVCTLSTAISELLFAQLL